MLGVECVSNGDVNLSSVSQTLELEAGRQPPGTLPHAGLLTYKAELEHVRYVINRNVPINKKKPDYCVTDCKKT